jgi:hypothetical protein
MLYSFPRSLAGRLHASSDVVIATVGGGVVLLVFFPLTVCAAGVKALLGITDKIVVPRLRYRISAERQSKAIVKAQNIAGSSFHR